MTQCIPSIVEDPPLISGIVFGKSCVVAKRDASNVVGGGIQFVLQSLVAILALDCA